MFLLFALDRTRVHLLSLLSGGRGYPLWRICRLTAPAAPYRWNQFPLYTSLRLDTPSGLRRGLDTTARERGENKNQNRKDSGGVRKTCNRIMGKGLRELATSHSPLARQPEYPIAPYLFATAWYHESHPIARPNRPKRHERTKIQTPHLDRQTQNRANEKGRL